MRLTLSAAAALAVAAVAALPATAQQAPNTVSGVIAAAGPDDWRAPDPAQTVYMDLPSGRVVIELAPALAPLHAENIAKLVREGYFDGLAVVRVQDNYVTQWGDPAEEGGTEGEAGGRRPVRTAKTTLPAEFVVKDGDRLNFTAIPGPDAYAPETGFVDGFPAARNPMTGEVWPVHCYGALGVSRDMSPDSGSGTGLYAVIGHAPRHLDRNITVAGRVLKGMEHLSALPRGTGPLGFYENPEQRTPILRARMEDQVPAAERERLQVLRTGTETWGRYVEARRNRRDDWFHEPQNAADVCNALPMVRAAP